MSAVIACRHAEVAPVVPMDHYVDGPPHIIKFMPERAVPEVFVNLPENRNHMPNHRGVIDSLDRPLGDVHRVGRTGLVIWHSPLRTHYAMRVANALVVKPTTG